MIGGNFGLVQAKRFSPTERETQPAAVTGPSAAATPASDGAKVEAIMCENGCAVQAVGSTGQ